MRHQSQCLIAAAASLALAGAASAANVDWLRSATLGQGLWNDTTNWSAFPNNGDVARISGSTMSSVLVDSTQGAVQPGFTDVGHTTGSDNLLEITNGTFVPRFDIRLGGNASNTTSGSARKGTVNQTGTSTVTASNVFIGFAKSGSGVYNMGGGTLTLNNIATASGAPLSPGLYVGSRALTLIDAGVFATFNHTAGDVSFADTDAPGTGSVQLGRTGVGVGRTAGTALYDMTGGTLSTPAIEFGSNDTTNGGGTNTFRLGGTGVATTGRVVVLNPGATNVFDFDGGTLKASQSNATFMQGLNAANVKAGGAKLDTNGFDVTVAQPLAHDAALGATADGGLTKSGAGTLTLSGVNTHTGGTTVNAGKLVAANADALGGGDLTVNNAVAEAQLGLSKAVTVNALSFSGTGSLDLTDNDLVIKSGTLAGVTAQIVAGYNNGTWDGAGINSSAAANDPNADTAIGFFDNAEVQLTSFSGVALTGPEIVVKYTYYGDADLTGVVDTDDFQLFLAGYQDSTLPRTWFYGDFDYTGVIDTDDFQVFLYGYQNQGGALSELSEAVASAEGISSSDRAFMQAAIAAVPEPASLGVLGLAGLSLLARRQRRGGRPGAERGQNCQ